LYHYELQVVDFTGNNLTYVVDNLFPSHNMANLQEVILGRCGIVRIERFAFRGLRNLDSVDLSSNLLVSVPSVPLASVPLLRELVLSGNPIVGIADFAFLGLSELLRLDMSECRGAIHQFSRIILNSDS
jgi:hypothetical protein